MPLLNPPNILPKGMFLIARTLRHHGKPVERASLKALLQPPSLPLRKAGTNTFDASLKALRDLGLAQTDGSTVTYNAKAPAPDDMETFYDGLLACIMSDAAIGEEDGTAQEDLMAALAWWCAQDPHAEPVGWDRVQELLSHDMGATFQSFPIGNSVPWLAFGRWAVSLGFAEQQSFGEPGGLRLIPDVTRALKRAVRISGLHGTVRADQFLTVVRAELPVVDGGRLAMRWRPTWDLPPGRQAVSGAIDRALSHALLRCAEDGLLGLLSLSDASKVTLSDGNAAHPISHVEIGADDA
ncbi:hypothetical protein GCM10010464_04170 [Pseudonocardia yunnanensis]|uniref:Protein DpdG n=1 Tax=Pseudonocardia yunnanensis TaxID=58107 RepID=A0ABW4EXT5_9PSEU